MRTSKLFFRTFKEAPHDADIISHQLLERGGFIRKLGKGLYCYTPIMWRVIKKIVGIIREELDNAGAQEVSLPYLHPAEVWQKSGRWDAYRAEKLLYTVEDREGHAYCLAPTHEEVMVTLIHNWVTSYKHLPLNLYQIGDKFRDEIRPRFGLMRGKEFYMKDGYSFSPTSEAMEAEYANMRQAYSNVFDRLGLDFVIVEAHGGKIGSGKSEEFQVKAEVGEDVVMVCGDYAANVEATVAIPPSYPFDKNLHALEHVATPGTQTIEALSAFLKVDPAQILKTLVYKLIYSDQEAYVAVAIRGDRQLNEVKVAERLGALEVTLASEDEARRLTGAGFGFIGPINCKLPFYADLTCQEMTNFVCAACEDDHHHIHVNWDRDLLRPEFQDFLLAEEGDTHPDGGVYTKQRGIEVGHIFNIGTQYTEKLGALFQDEAGEMQPMWMGTFGIGIGRTAAACVEQKHDERGILWPMAIAPFKILITAATTKDEAQVAAATRLYEELVGADLEPLYDDRDERLGFKLKDSDLIGLPYKLIVGKAFANEGKVEIESRTGEKQLLAIDEVLPWAKQALCP